MVEVNHKEKIFSLQELNSAIKALLSQAFPDTLWVTAEIAECKCNQKGHCYLELVEKEDDRTIAQIKATIWAYDYRRLSLKFEKATGESLKAGMKILLLASVAFHEVYGLSLTVKDLDPSYTLGEMARKKKEVIERLTREGLINLNKGLMLPLVPQRIAVISSPTAAGYGDFFRQLDNNPFGYKFVHVLFPAMMQGPDAEHSIIAAFEGIRRRQRSFDVVAVIRGGGSAIDLNCFDGYNLAAHAARFPLPIITGIGHEKDDSVLDVVAHTRLKTPTAVAEFLISGLRSFEEKVLDLRTRLTGSVERLLKDSRYGLNSLGQRLYYVPLKITSHHLNRLDILFANIGSLARQLFGKEEGRFAALEQALKHLDPANVLRRGYSITRHKGKIIRNAADLGKWAVIETKFLRGSVTSIVQERKEGARSEQKQTADLLPGFE